jgi:hypothetical protein
MNNFGSSAPSPQRKKSKKSVNFSGGASFSKDYDETPLDQSKVQEPEARSPKKVNIDDSSMFKNNQTSQVNPQSTFPNNQTPFLNNQIPPPNSQTPFPNSGLIKVQPVQGNSERRQTAGKGENVGTSIENSSLKPNVNNALANYSKLCKEI